MAWGITIWIFLCGGGVLFLFGVFLRYGVATIGEFLCAAVTAGIFYGMLNALFGALLGG